RNDARLIRFGREGARIALTGDRAGSPLELNVILHAGAAKRASLNGARLQAAEQLRGEVAALGFTPDRLVVVKGGPAARRAYFDRALGRGMPAQAALPAEYGAALAQRNAALRGISLGYSTREALRPWTERVADLGTQLVAARGEVIAALEPLFPLDDVLSELDPDRRLILAERLRTYGQALITSTSAAALPAEPDQLVEVEAGDAGTVLR